MALPALQVVPAESNRSLESRASPERVDLSPLWSNTQEAKLETLQRDYAELNSAIF